MSLAELRGRVHGLKIRGRLALLLSGISGPPRGMQRGGRGCFQFQTETTSEVAADALLALLYAKHAGPRRARKAEPKAMRAKNAETLFLPYAARARVRSQELLDLFGDRTREAAVLPGAALPRRV